MEAHEWEISLEQKGVTGDLCEAMLLKARETANANPNSVFSYSVWKACEELNSYLSDPQGIPAEYGREITRVVAGPLKKLITDGAFVTENREAMASLAELLAGLNSLRSLPRDSHGWALPKTDNTYG